MRNEFFAQIIKQLTRNGNADSCAQGWNLLIVILDTLKPPKDIENYLEKWLRDHKPTNTDTIGDDAQFYVKLLHQTIFLGSRQQIPTLRDIGLLMNGEGIRTLETVKTVKTSNMNEFHKSKSEQSNASVSKSEQYYSDQKERDYSRSTLNKANPPKLTSVHEGKLEQQRATLQWQRTVDKINRFDMNNAQPGSIPLFEEEDRDRDRNRVYYCGYTMDDERSIGNNFHYAPHKPKRMNATHTNHKSQPGQPRNVPNSVTEVVAKDYNNNILDL